MAEPAHLYFLDEPLNYLDRHYRNAFIELVHEKSPTLIIVEHDSLWGSFA